MGIYVYTLRKNTIKATNMDTGTPIEVGVTKYAYKESWGSGSYSRTVARQHASADRARDANPNLDLATFGDPKEHDFDRDGSMVVFRTGSNFTSFYDTKFPGEPIGRLYKNGKKFEFEPIPA